MKFAAKCVHLILFGTRELICPCRLYYSDPGNIFINSLWDAISALLDPDPPTEPDRILDITFLFLYLDARLRAYYHMSPGLFSV
jgi:hypothetical protein